MNIETIKTTDVVTYWEQNPRRQKKEIIDALHVNMSINGFNAEFPLQVFTFDGDNRFHLADGHHRYEAAKNANMPTVPAIVVQGTPDEHYESLQLANMQHDVSLGTVAQMFTPAEKRDAVKRLLTLPKYWERTNVWLGKAFRTHANSIGNWRNEQGSQICDPSNPLGLPNDRLNELHELILKAERISKDGQIQPVQNCKLREQLLAHRVVIENNAFQSAVDLLFKEAKRLEVKPKSFRDWVNTHTMSLEFVAALCPSFRDDTEIFVESVIDEVHERLLVGYRNTGEVEWYTPRDIIERVRRTMMGIDIDPASCDDANQHICAQRHYTKSDDGLAHPWNGTVFVNPPFSDIQAFTDKFIAEAKCGNMTAGCFLADSLGQPNWFMDLLGFCNAFFVYTERSGRFEYWNGDRRLNGKARGYIFYYGDNVKYFAESFKDIGKIYSEVKI